MPALSTEINRYIDNLPDPAGARLFFERLKEEHPAVAKRISGKPELCTHLLTLAAYSPLLAETLLQHPDYINWLARERDLSQIKPKEQLLEELARFASVNSSLSLSIQLTRFKRRELLRIYLRDCLKLATLSETTEEFSNLADAMLERALQVCYQPLWSRYGRPQQLDERGRLHTAEFAIVGLGKLGSKELNYSSDIDPIFIYSADGETAGGNESIPNKLFFIKLAEAVVKTIGAPMGEGAVFRVDLRLRPRGREGALVISVAEAVRYYRQEAQNWERQALMRARACAGDTRTVEQFLHQVHDQIFRPEPLIEALQDVKRAKEKIDSQQASRTGGYNVKLGKGGIREIEFIVQALEICYGGRDAWLRASQTLIGLQRLADKNLISANERTWLTQAYTFLRVVEHRLQMEHGLQTHSLPLTEEKMLLLARRCGYPDFTAFDRDLQLHCQNVSTVYQRVFSQNSEQTKLASQPISPAAKLPKLNLNNPQIVDPAAFDRLFQEAINTFVATPTLVAGNDASTIAAAIAAGLANTINPHRAVRRLRDYALSAATETAQQFTGLTSEQIRELTIIAGVSQYFIQILMAHPALAQSLGGSATIAIETITPTEMRVRFANAIAGLNFDQAAAALRRCWYQELIKLARYDLLVANTTEAEPAIQDLRRINLAQTALADAVLAVASELAISIASEHYQRTAAPLRYTILGLGRLGHCGIDYDSDLDLVFVYSDEPGPVAIQATNQEFYARVTELMIQLLSALTREGMLYRIDMRLRPDGRNGLLATSYDNLQQYLQERAAIWELMAYLKLRAVVGNDDFGQQLTDQTVQLLFARAAQSADLLAGEVRQMRTRLEREKARQQDYKFGRGGMLDVYFATRYLQLKHRIADPPQRGTLSLIDHLNSIGILSPAQSEGFRRGYSFLRRLDHQVRLQLERPQSALPHNPAQQLDLARKLGFADEQQLLDQYQQQLNAIRQIYLEIMSD